MYPWLVHLEDNNAKPTLFFSRPEASWMLDVSHQDEYCHLDFYVTAHIDGDPTFNPLVNILHIFSTLARKTLVNEIGNWILFLFDSCQKTASLQAVNKN